MRYFGKVFCGRSLHRPLFVADLYPQQLNGECSTLCQLFNRGCNSSLFQNRDVHPTIQKRRSDARLDSLVNPQEAIIHPPPPSAVPKIGPKKLSQVTPAVKQISGDLTNSLKISCKTAKSETRKKLRNWLPVGWGLKSEVWKGHENMLLEPFVPNNLSIGHSFFTPTYWEVYDLCRPFDRVSSTGGLQYCSLPLPLGQKLEPSKYHSEAN